MAAIASSCLMIKFYDWLRLFESTAFYITLIEYTLKDIKPFMLLFLICMMIFGIPLVMLELNRSEEDQLIIEIGATSGIWVLDSIYNQYLLSIGEFESLETIEESSSQKGIAIIFFLISTFITQITILNMLIAIIGESFSYCLENRDELSLKTKLDILSSQAPSLPQVDA